MSGLRPAPSAGSVSELETNSVRLADLRTTGTRSSTVSSPLRLRNRYAPLEEQDPEIISWGNGSLLFHRRSQDNSRRSTTIPQGRVDSPEPSDSGARVARRGPPPLNPSRDEGDFWDPVSVPEQGAFSEPANAASSRGITLSLNSEAPDLPDAGEPHGPALPPWWHYQQARALAAAALADIDLDLPAEEASEAGARAAAASDLFHDAADSLSRAQARDPEDFPAYFDAFEAVPSYDNVYNEAQRGELYGALPQPDWGMESLPSLPPQEAPRSPPSDFEFDQEDLDFLAEYDANNVSLPQPAGPATVEARPDFAIDEGKHADPNEAFHAAQDAAEKEGRARLLAAHQGKRRPRSLRSTDSTADSSVQEMIKVYDLETLEQQSSTASSNEESSNEDLTSDNQESMGTADTSPTSWFEAIRRGVIRLGPNSPPSEDSSSQDEAWSSDEKGNDEREDFAAPHLRVPPYCRSTNVQSIIRNGVRLHVDVSDPPASRTFYPQSQAEQAYVDALERDGVIKPGKAVFYTSHWMRYVGTKARLIFDGRELNMRCKKPPAFHAKGPESQARLAAKYNFSAGTDLKNAFFSIRLATKYQKYFGLRTPTGSYVYQSIPFGWSWSPFLLHLCADEVIKEALSQGIPCTRYVDDIRVFGNTRAETNASLARILKLCIDAGWRINWKKTEWASPRFISLGILYDLSNKTTQIAPGSIAALASALQDLRVRKLFVTKRQLWSYLGSMVFFNFAIPASLARVNPLLAFGADDDFNKRYRVAECTHFIAAALKFYGTRKPIPLQHHVTKPLDVFTDATETQIGIVHPLLGLTVAARIPRRRIYGAEALAASVALTLPMPKHFRLRIDNKALVHAIAKGRSNDPAANALCDQIRQKREDGHVVTAAWIRGTSNPADVPSRVMLTPEKAAPVTVQPLQCDLAPRSLFPQMFAHSVPEVPLGASRLSNS